jgi:tRNA U34 5-methylaminomethyl-2-thiouridine-forming methyltransferase MnmC
MAAAEGDGQGWRAQPTADGSPSLYSLRFGEAFHSDRGAYREAIETYVLPAELERFTRGHSLTVLDVGVGLGYNSACLVEACAERGLTLRWWGLELDPGPLNQVLIDANYRQLWQPPTLALLQTLSNGAEPGGSSRFHHPAGSGELLWGDARDRIQTLLSRRRGTFDLVLLDAFSPRRCPELWSLEFLGSLATLLRADGRLITYCAAAAVRASLAAAALQLASLTVSRLGEGDRWGERWSQGTLASPTALPASDRFRPLTTMELEHLSTRAAEPYRDPDGLGVAATILARRAEAQRRSTAISTTAWRARWPRGDRDRGDEG